MYCVIVYEFPFAIHSWYGLGVGHKLYSLRNEAPPFCMHKHPLQSKSSGAAFFVYGSDLPRSSESQQWSLHAESLKLADLKVLLSVLASKLSPLQFL